MEQRKLFPFPYPYFSRCCSACPYHIFTDVSEEKSKCTTKKTTTTKTPTSTKTTTTKQIIFPININTCTYEDLLNIKGLGEKKAEKIIQYRNEFGLYKSIEEIKNISGIGNTLFDAIKEYITV